MKPNQGDPDDFEAYAPPRPGQDALDFSGTYAPKPGKNIAYAAKPNLAYVPKPSPAPVPKRNGQPHPLAPYFSRPTDIHARFSPPRGVPNAPPRTLNYGRYILWRGQKRNAELIISSHGERLFGRAVTVPKGMELRFYGPDHAAIDTYNIYRAFVKDGVGARGTYEIVSGGQHCMDHYLTTFQRQYSNYSEVYEHVLSCLPYYDVVTIATTPDQHWKEWVQLSELLEHLHFHKHRYSRIHCFHCRVMGDATVKQFPAVKPYLKKPYVVR